MTLLFLRRKIFNFVDFLIRLFLNKHYFKIC
jgi:hypothetical protein